MPISRRPGLRRLLGAAALALTAACGDRTGPDFSGFEVRQLSVGTDYSCVLGADSTAFCWGRNDDRELGSRASEPATLSPLLVPARPLQIAALDAGVGRTCVLLRTGKPLCAGELIGSLRQLPGDVTLSQVSVGARICGLTPEGGVVCWEAITAAPRSIELPHPVARVIAGPTETDCALDAEGALYCWTPTGPPAPVVPDERFSHVGIGDYHACGLTNDARVLCWGRNGDGQLGHRRSGTGPSEPAGTRRSYRAVTAGGSHSCAISVDGDLYCWGLASSGQLGIGGTAPYGTSWGIPVSVAGEQRWVSVEAGSRHTCGVTVDGVVYCWGDNSRGGIGDGTITPRGAPTRVGGAL